MRNRLRVIGGVCAALVVASTGAVVASTAPAGASQGISGNVIKVGGIYDSTSFTGALAGFQARIDRANRTHELGKYKIDLVSMSDDTGNPQTDLTDTQNLVQRQRVFAIAPTVTAGFGTASAQVAANGQVPYFGAGFTDAFCKPNTWGLGPTGCAIGGTYTNGIAISQVAHAVGKPVNRLRWAFVGLDIPTGTQADDAYAGLAKSQGGNVVYNQAIIPVSVGNVAPIVSAVEATKPDVIWIIAGAQAIALKTAFKANGFSGALVDNALYAPGLLNIQAVASAVDNTYVEATTPVLEQPTPYVKQMVADYKAAGKPASAITFGGEYAYMVADDMVAALKRVAPNFSKVHALLQSGFTYVPQVGGAPVRFPFMFDASTNCGSTVKAVGSVYKVVTPFQCSTKYYKNP
jgi:ABC-type branched-subunit amino acid transport system substrate-binding protein